MMTESGPPRFVRGHNSPTFIDVWANAETTVVFLHGDVQWAELLPQPRRGVAAHTTSIGSRPGLDPIGAFSWVVARFCTHLCGGCAPKAQKQMCADREGPKCTDLGRFRAG